MGGEIRNRELPSRAFCPPGRTPAGRKRIFRAAGVAVAQLRGGTARRASVGWQRTRFPRRFLTMRRFAFTAFTAFALAGGFEPAGAAITRQASEKVVPV